MRFHPLAAALAALVPALAQAAIPADIDNAFARYTQMPHELLPILRKAQDKESANAAATELNAVLPKLYELRSELTKISSLKPEVSAELVRKYSMTMRRNWGKVYEEIFRLQKQRCYDSLAFFKQFQVLCMMLDQ
ncbi:MAG: hypothetical protein Q4F38_01005 [Akkermansia sp.]|nr:hypothetical protein [Akkermansia sp.]